MNKDQVNTAEWLRRGATAMAAGRVGLGLAALARPALLTGAWVGPPGDSPGEGLAGRVLGRALGARDLALGLGTLAALQRPAGPDTDQAAKTWVSLSALADGADLLVTLGAWACCPRGSAGWSRRPPAARPPSACPPWPRPEPDPTRVTRSRAAR